LRPGQGHRLCAHHLALPIRPARRLDTTIPSTQPARASPCSRSWMRSRLSEELWRQYPNHRSDVEQVVLTCWSVLQTQARQANHALHLNKSKRTSFCSPMIRTLTGRLQRTHARSLTSRPTTTDQSRSRSSILTGASRHGARRGISRLNLTQFQQCRISLSISLGALVPTSLLELKPNHPVTKSERDRRFIYYSYTSGFLPAVEGENAYSSYSEDEVTSSLYKTVGIAIGGLESPPTSMLPSLRGRRLFFDCSATPAGRKGCPPQLSHALAAFVGRSGARVVSDVRAADWLVVSERSGGAYWHVSISIDPSCLDLQWLCSSASRPGPSQPIKDHGYRPASARPLCSRRRGTD
jgi:hypothetical protein